MEKEGLSYHEALLHLAKKYNIEVQERELTDEEREKQSEREAMLVANEWAMKQMESDLQNTDEGRDIGLQYITQRGVTDEAIRAFHLGYAIDKGDHLVSVARKAGFSIETFKKLGLVGTSQQGRDYDRFRGRVIYPIINSSGKVIAFGGRDLKGGLAKYINSPESELYKKSNELYGIFQARSSIVRENRCFLVEGYMDVIGMWQAGLKNVVASSGTALTNGQIAMIHRFTENITLIYDGDAAGIKAALRGIDMLLSHRLKVSVLLLPNGEDPDSFARGRTPEEFRQYVADHETDVIRFKAQVLLDEVRSNPQKRIEAVSSVVESIAHIPDPISRDVYIQECSRILNIPDTTIAKSVARSRAALIESSKRERAVRRMEDNTPETPTPSAAVKTDGDTAPKTEQLQPARSSAMYPLEMPVIRFCVRFGYMDFCDRAEGDTREGKMSVVDYISDELTLDEMKFSIEIYNHILDILKEHQPKFKDFLRAESLRLDAEMEAIRKERIAGFAMSDLSVMELEMAEKKLDESIKESKRAKLVEFAKEYPGRLLASHEDNAVRYEAMELIRERHHLSNIYAKEGAGESEEAQLFTLVPKSLMVWKNELLNIRRNELMKQFQAISGKGDAEAEHRLQMELASLMTLQKEVAKDLGDRILRINR
jgi:DNA primase